MSSMTLLPTLVFPFQGVLLFPPESAPVATKSLHATPNGLIDPVMFGPNITGGFGNVVWTREVRGAHTVGLGNPQSVNRNVTDGGSEHVGWVDFDASRSASVYGGSTVQPSSVRSLFCIKS